MKLNFVKLSPAENTTVLITDYVSTIDYAKVANKVMSYNYLNAEQVGFIKESKDDKSVLRLEMPGEEFCGDGLMSAAVVARWMEYCSEDEFKLESSGLNSSVKCKVRSIQRNLYKVKMSMPVEHQLVDYETTCRNHKVSGKLVILSGINHLILNNDQNKYELEFIAELVKQVALELKVKAMGVIPYRTVGKEIKIEPCIHVPKTGKLLFESGCGSGTLALGFYLSQKYNRSVNMNIKQPGGVINVEVNVLNSVNEGMRQVESAYLETDILITCKGEVYI